MTVCHLGVALREALVNNFARRAQECFMVELQFTQILIHTKAKVLRITHYSHKRSHALVPEEGGEPRIEVTVIICSFGGRTLYCWLSGFKCLDRIFCVYSIACKSLFSISVLQKPYIKTGEHIQEKNMMTPEDCILYHIAFCVTIQRPCSNPSTGNCIRARYRLKYFERKINFGNRN